MIAEYGLNHTVSSAEFEPARRPLGWSQAPKSVHRVGRLVLPWAPCFQEAVRRPEVQNHNQQPDVSRVISTNRWMNLTALGYGLWPMHAAVRAADRTHGFRVHIGTFQILPVCEREGERASRGIWGRSHADRTLVASLLLVAMPGAPSSFLFLVVRPGASSSVFASSGDEFFLFPPRHPSEVRDSWRVAHKSE